MTLTVKHYDTTITIAKERDDQNIDELVTLFRTLVLAMGYAPETVARGFNDDEPEEA